jgi:aminopeptidase N
MQVTVLRPVQPQLKELATEASQALARLDAERLQELALCCQELCRGLTANESDERDALREQARAAADDVAIFARVLEATRANLQVMQRLRALRAERLEYGPWGTTEDGRGND